MKLSERVVSRIGGVWEKAIQQWVRLTGRAVEPSAAAWLAGPVGFSRIGPGFYENYARTAGLTVQDLPHAGLLQDFAALRSARFDPEQVHPDIVDFYERTAHYTLDAWVQWSGPFSPFARSLISAISRNIEQLVLPLTPLTTSQGMSSRIITLADGAGEVAYSGWLRKAISTGEIVYAGFYTTCQPPEFAGPCVKTVFPLPHGSATVILRPTNGPNRSFKLISSGRKFGGPGYYRIHRTKSGILRVKHIPIKETIHVYVDANDVLRTDHHFKFWGLKFLTLHYKISAKSALTDRG